MKSFFYNPQESRLKAGWRILLFLTIFWLFAALIFFVKPLFGDIGKREFLQDYSLIIVAILAFAATVATCISRPFLDKKTFISLGLKLNNRTWQDILFGFILSGLMAGVFFIVLLTLDAITYNGLNWGATSMNSDQEFHFVNYMSVISIGSLTLLLTEHIIVGYWEELFFRGYLFQNMTEGLGRVTAIVISCILYGIVHATNPNAGLLSSLIIILFGFLRIYGYLTTKLLWLSIGMHIGWNFFQGPIFGFAASGHKKVTLIDIVINSDKEWLTGGEFGPEGSLLIIPILILALGSIKWYSKSHRS